MLLLTSDILLFGFVCSSGFCFSVSILFSFCITWTLFKILIYFCAFECLSVLWVYLSVDLSIISMIYHSLLVSIFYIPWWGVETSLHLGPSLLLNIILVSYRWYNFCCSHYVWLTNVMRKRTIYCIYSVLSIVLFSQCSESLSFAFPFLCEDFL